MTQAVRGQCCHLRQPEFVAWQSWEECGVSGPTGWQQVRAEHEGMFHDSTPFCGEEVLGCNLLTHVLWQQLLCMVPQSLNGSEVVDQNYAVQHCHTATEAGEALA